MFEKKPRQEDDRDPFQVERQTNARAALRVLLALYLAYVIVKLVRGYFAGDLGMPMGVYYTALVIFVAAEFAIVAFTVRRWLQSREKIDRAWERQAAAAAREESAAEPDPDAPEPMTSGPENGMNGPENGMDGPENGMNALENEPDAPESGADEPEDAP